MFCNNCGTQLPDNAAFCNNCGAQVNAGTQPVYTAPVQQYNAPVYNNTPSVNYTGATSDKSKITAIVALLAGLISVILMCATEVIVYGLKSSSAYDETYNIFKLLDMGTGSDTGDAAMGCTIAGVVCGGIGVLLLLLAVAGSNVKAGCASGAGTCLIMYLICMMVSVYAILSDGKPSSIKFGFGVMGWIAIVVGLIGAITAFAAASQAKKKMATTPIRF